jgi:hypothetical protein
MIDCLPLVNLLKPLKGFAPVAGKEKIGVGKESRKVDKEKRILITSLYLSFYSLRKEAYRYEKEG